MRVLLAVCLFASTAVAARTVEGRVTNAATGAGVAGVRVRLMPAAEGERYDATTDAEGRFRIEDVQDGAYRARYTAPGFLPVPKAGDQLPPFAVSSAAEPMRLDMRMQPLGTLSGRVVDTAGKPVADAGVWLVAGERWCGPPQCSPDKRQSKTGANGEYHVAELPDGPWLVSATAPPSLAPPPSTEDARLGWAQTFHPGVSDPQAAEAVLVRGGEQWLPDIKLRATPVHRVRGRVLDSGGRPVPKALVLLGKGYGPPLTQEAKSDGTFEFAVVSDDEWRLSAAMNQSGGVHLRGAQWITIHGRDAEDVVVRLEAPFALTGRLILQAPEGTPKPEAPPIDLVLVSRDTILSDDASGSSPIRRDGGELEVAAVYPGTYAVMQISDSPAPYYLDSIRLGDRDASGDFPLASGALPLTVTYKLGGGTVRGTVESCGAGAVLLVPTDAALRRPGFFRVTPCGPNGRFEFAAVRPGEYYGVADAGNPSPLILRDDRFLKQGVTLTVRANETTSAEIPVARR